MKLFLPAHCHLIHPSHLAHRHGASIFSISVSNPTSMGAFDGGTGFFPQTENQRDRPLPHSRATNPFLSCPWSRFPRPAVPVANTGPKVNAARHVCVCAQQRGVANGQEAHACSVASGTEQRSSYCHGVGWWQIPLVDGDYAAPAADPLRLLTRRPYHSPAFCCSPKEHVHTPTPAY